MTSKGRKKDYRTTAQESISPPQPGFKQPGFEQLAGNSAQIEKLNSANADELDGLVEELRLQSDPTDRERLVDAAEAAEESGEEYGSCIQGPFWVAYKAGILTKTQFDKIIALGAVEEESGAPRLQRLLGAKALENCSEKELYPTAKPRPGDLILFVGDEIAEAFHVALATGKGGECYSLNDNMTRKVVTSTIEAQLSSETISGMGLRALIRPFPL